MSHRNAMRVRCAVVLAFLALGIPAVAGAREPRAHDGFFLRLSGGAGHASTKLEEGSVPPFGPGTTTKIELSGTTGDVNLAIGGVVAPNLALHATLWGWSINDPESKLSISGAGDSTVTTNSTLAMGALGAGLTYYVMPINIYLSASFGMGSLSINADGNDGTSNAGFAMDLTLGKEWWVGESWGLGLSGGFNYLTAQDHDIAGSSENWSGPGYALRFSATFN